MANQIEIEIVAKLDKFEKDLQSLKSTAEKSGAAIGKELGDSLGDKVSGSFKALGAAALAAGAAIVSAFAFNKIIEAASAQEAAVGKLNQSLASAGTFSQAASLSIQEFANTIQRTTTLEDDAVIAGVALARNFARSNEEAVALTKAAIDLSAATGISLDTAVENLGKTLSGTSGRLATQIPLVKSLTEEQLKAGAAIQLVSDRFSGSASGQINTFSGAIKQLKNVFSDLLEELGNVIIKSPVVREVIKFMSAQFLKLTESIKGIAGQGDILGDIIKKTVEWGFSINKYVVAPLELVWNLGKIVFGAIQTGVQAVIVSFANLALGALNVIGIFSDKFKGAEESVRTFADSSKTVLDDFVVSTQQKMSEALNFEGTSASEAFLTQLQTTVDSATAIQQTYSNNAKAITADQTATQIQSINMFEAAYKAMSTRVALTNQQILAGWMQLRISMFQTFVTGFQGALSSIGKALVEGGNVFAAFGKAILGLFGDLALQLGQFYLLLGLATIWLNPAAGAGQIAGGIALSILGGALKALAGGGGGAAATPASAGGNNGGGVAAGTSAPIGDSATSQQVAQNQQPGTAINVNIAGNVLGDKRTLGRDIADAINESFGTNGVTIAQGAIV